jgi:hypothetical protein
MPTSRHASLPGVREDPGPVRPWTCRFSRSGSDARSAGSGTPWASNWRPCCPSSVFVRAWVAMAPCSDTQGTMLPTAGQRQLKPIACAGTADVYRRDLLGGLLHEYDQAAGPNRGFYTLQGS